MGKLFEEICSMENLNFTFNKLGKKNKRSGPDSISWHEIDVQKYTYLKNLHEQLINKTYTPNEDVYFEKPYFPGSNKILRYVEMNIREKIVEYAIKHVIYPILDMKWCNFSCAYRKGMGEKHVNLLLEEYKEIGCCYFIAVDIRAYYQTVNNLILHDILLNQLDDLLCVELIKKCLHINDKRTGIPIGHVLSTLCSNVYLHPVDIKFSNCNAIRYADNYCFAANSEKELLVLVNELECELLALGLTLNGDKTRLVYAPLSFEDLLI